MKRSLIFLFVCTLIYNSPITAQGLLKKVTKSMTNELLGKSDNASNNKNSNQPEPACACDKAEVVLDLGGKLQLDYQEITISVLDDGSMLVRARDVNKYYILKNGVTYGPFNPDDPKVKEFEPVNEEDNDNDTFLKKNKPYITRAGDKFLITFEGKVYGPYAQINSFVVTKLKTKFAAVVVENILTSEEEGKKMDEAMKNARTDQERSDLALEYAQQMAQKMQQAGGTQGLTPKLVSNVPNVTTDVSKTMAGTLNGNIKYDDILVVAYDKILDLQGNNLLTLKKEAFGAEQLFVNSDNTKYAYYNYGTIAFNDNTSLPDLFNPLMIKSDGQVYLSYMYYSPKKNSIMQCKIPF